MADYLDPLRSKAKLASKQSVLDKFKENSNMRTSSAYVDPRSSFYKYPGQYNVMGFVGPNDPTKVYVQGGLTKETVPAHEAAHSQQFLSGQDLNIARKEKEKYGFLRRKLNPNATDSDVLTAHHYSHPLEFLAQLQAIEATMPEGSRVWDHPEIKKLNIPDDAKHFYDQYMFPTMDKMTTPDYFRSGSPADYKPESFANDNRRLKGLVQPIIDRFSGRDSRPEYTQSNSPSYFQQFLNTFK